ncbi:MAG: hypothetical protein ACE5OP_13230 [Candidatus Glassbacteria bacterium]
MAEVGIGCKGKAKGATGGRKEIMSACFLRDGVPTYIHDLERSLSFSRRSGKFEGQEVLTKIAPKNSHGTAYQDNTFSP